MRKIIPALLVFVAVEMAIVAAFDLAWRLAEAACAPVTVVVPAVSVRAPGGAEMIYWPCLVFDPVFD